MRKIFRRRGVLVATLALVTLVAIGATAGIGLYLKERGENKESMSEFLKEHKGLADYHKNNHSQALAIIKEKSEAGGEAVRGPAQELYENRAFPNDTVAYPQTIGTYTAFSSMLQKGYGKKAHWTELGPITPNVDALATYTGRPTTNSGRVTSLAISSNCTSSKAASCTLLVGAAGGGVWRSTNALATHPTWTPSNDGIPSNAIGSLYVDPTDASGQTVYAGTGEPNGSSDSEAGIGLYKSTDGGVHWSLVPGSVAAAKDRSIAAISVDPANPKHIWIGTAVARHGSSSVNGGRYTPPGAPTVGLYESTDGGASFSLVFSEPSDSVDPTSATGGDYFRGGVSNIQYDKISKRIYFSIFDYGLYRQKTGAGYERIFDSECVGHPACSLSGRTEFAVAPLPNGKLRIYLGDSGISEATFWRTDDANAAAPSFTELSNWIRRRRASTRSTTAASSARTDMPGRLTSGQTGRGLARRADAVRRDLHLHASFERARGAALDERRRALHGHDRRCAVAANRHAPRPARDRVHR